MDEKIEKGSIDRWGAERFTPRRNAKSESERRSGVIIGITKAGI